MWFQVICVMFGAQIIQISLGIWIFPILAAILDAILNCMGVICHLCWLCTLSNPSPCCFKYVCYVWCANYKTIPFKTYLLEYEYFLFWQTSHWTDHNHSWGHLSVVLTSIRENLFCQAKRVRMMQNMPPTQNALLQHTNRSMLQASIWTTSLCSMQNVPTPDTFGWSRTEEDSWKRNWMTLPEASKSCRELIKG